MKCIVLGGGGFIGANLARRLATDGHSVLTIDCDYPTWRNPESSSDQSWRADLEWWPPAGEIRCLEANLAAWQDHDMSELFMIEEANWVFHLAADMGGVGYFHSDADLGAALTNGRITGNVLAAVKPHQRLFYASSVCAYPIELMQPGARPISESDLGFGTPDALYGAEKLHGARLCSKMPNARVGLFDTIYGPLQEHAGRRMKFPAAVATKALAARQTGTLELWGDGSQVRCYLYVDDAVERIVRVMESDRYDGPVNICAETPASCLEVARMALEIAGVPDATITTNPSEPTGAIHRVIDGSKFEATYGPAYETPLSVGFSKFMAWLDR